MPIKDLDTQSKVFSIVLGAEYIIGDYYDMVQTFANEWGLKYCTIYHNKDSDYMHYHLFIELGKRWRMITMLNRLSKALNCNIENISIRIPSSITGAIQYLIHKNDPFKYQYNVADLVYNYDLKFIVDILESEFYSSELTTTQLIDIVYNSKNVIEIICKIGIGKYQHYRNTINDILEYKRKNEIEL